MNQNFDFISTGKYDVGSVRNFLLDEIRNRSRKVYTPAFHTMYALLCALAIFLAVWGTRLGLDIMSCLTLQMFAPAMYVFTFMYSSVYLKAAAVFLPLLASVGMVFAFSVPATPNSLSPYILTYLQILLVSIVLAKTIISGYSKTTCFVIVSLSYAAIIFCNIAIAVIYAYGTISPSILVKAIDDYFSSIFKTSMQTISEIYTVENLRLMFGYAEDMSKEAILLDLQNTLISAFKSVKMFLPSIFAVSCMLCSFATVAFFSMFARIFKFNIFVCIMDKHWTYRLSTISIKIYDILFVLFILCIFIDFSASFNAAVTNLFIILTPLMFVAGVKSIYSLLFSKMKKKVGAVWVTIAICFGAAFILGMISFLLIGSIGTAFLISRDRAEKLIMPVKIMQDTAALEELKNPYAQQQEC